MSNIGNNTQVNNNLQMLIMKSEGEKDRQSSASQLARDAMEALHPANVLGGIAEVFKALGSISG